jgi:tetratricopeptide (TPR) repeat protein
MRKFVIIIFCGLTISCFSQNHEVDSLRYLLNKKIADTSKVLLLLQIGISYVNTIPDSFYYYFNQGIQVGQAINDPKQKAISLENIGATLSFIGTFPEALHISLKSLKIAEQTKDPLTICASFIGLGNVYYSQNNFRESLEYFFKALRVAESLQDKRTIDKCLTNIGDAYLKLDLLDSALYYSQKGYQNSRTTNDKLLLADELNNLGSIYVRLNINSLAVDYYRLALQNESEINDENVCLSTLGIANIFQKQHLNDSALFYGYRCFALASANNFSFSQASASSFIASLYEAMKRPDSALKYLKLSITLKDSLFSQEKLKSFQSMTFEENTRQQNIRDQIKKANENAIRDLQLLAIGVFIPIFFLFVLFLSRTKVKPRVVEFLGIVSLLLLFEFITDLIYPYVSDWTNENPVWEMLILVILAAFLEPLNHKLEHWVKAKLVHAPIKKLPLPEVSEQHLLPPIA